MDHHPNQFALLRTRRFWPLFVTQAIGAFNDNAFRYALSILLIYDLGPRLGFNAALLNTVSAGLLILPFFVFSATAGQIADKFDKALLARRIKLIEIAIVALASFSLFTDQVWLQLLTVLLTGIQSAFFGPIKYSILPQHLEREELLGGNGLIEMGTFLSILLGTLFGSFAIQSELGRHAVSVVMIGLAIIAYMSARQIPEAPAPQPDLRINPNIAEETWRMIGIARERKEVFLAILGISWFWFLGVVFLTQIPLFTQTELAANETVASLIIAAFTVAIGMGSIVTNRLLKGEVSVKYVPVAAILITLFIIDLYFATGALRTSDASTPRTVADIVSTFSGWRILVDLTAIAFCAGLFAVPLYALVQSRSSPQKRARVIAANNIINAIFMTAATLISFLALGAGLSVRGLFLVTGLANAIAAAWICQLLPQELAAYVARRLFRLFYRVEIKGFENFAKAGRKALIVANHTSFLDGPLISAFLPERCHFAINTHIANRWWVRPAFQLFDLLPIDPANPMAIKTLANGLKRGRKVVIFPEGRITRTGSLMKVYEGPGVIAHLAGAKILPVRIDGAQYTPFSLMKGKHRLRWFPKITLTFLPPIKPDAPADLKGGALREFLADKLYDVMTDMMFRTSFADETLFRSLLKARRIHGRNHAILEDIQRTPLTYGRIVMASFILGRRLAELTPGEKRVGVLLPTAAGCFITLFALHASGRVPALLNYSTGAANMAGACRTAEIKTIITSRRFVEAGNFADDIAVLEKEARIIWIEDVREKLGLGDKLYGLYAGLFPKAALSRLGYNDDAHAPAVVIFTSGSEGTPKGVVLSHHNLQANRHQAAARIDFTPKDIVFNAMPMFHTFGLNAGTLLPILAGVRTFLYPSPLHYKIVPEMAYDINATILFGTDTFLTGYARNAHPYDFYAVRFVVAGAERVRPETRQTWMDIFGLRILEGYGVTECSPVLAVNTPIHYRAGTVGRLLDGIDYRLDKVEGIEEGGRLVVKGPNIMIGYLRADRPGVIDPPAEGWYDTGDIVKVDEKRYITILGRAKRFCKIAGEMVSLAAVESKLQQAFPEHVQAVVAIPDPRKGEQLVLFTTDQGLDRKRLADGLRAQGATELMVPKVIIPVETMPILGTGKFDYVTLNRMARERAEPKDDAAEP
ncbi:acyl-[ACP]--phospholipid O-acyltransferase [Taklimakanibacter lacteus]|uniref:acyl-[ACP]--phospholipid O-acyltransferase n=1 Tax=Taklimakanibacter lacteus TaxID=2268456 RepID=UPI000E662350